MASVADECMLVLVAGGENHNKFYHVSIDVDGSITKRWGRVGAQGQSQVLRGSTLEYQKLIAEKTKKGYRKVDVLKDTVAKDAGLGEIAKSGLLKTGTTDPQLEKLIEKLVAINKHEIVSTSGGLIKVAADGAVSTPLGMVGLNTIQDARKSLAQLERLSGRDRVRVLEEYLTLIPQVVPRARGWEQDFLASSSELREQATFLDQLRDSVAYYEDKKQRAKDAAGLSKDDLEAKYKDLFRYQVDVLDPKDKKFREIRRYYDSTRNRSHSAARLELKRVYTLTSKPEEEKAYQALLRKIGNERQLWHGTRAFNLLSILRKGLFVPPTYGTSITTTGRMFGDGIYLSDQSTKSLNYSFGYWGGGAAGRDNNCFMLLTDAALGHEFRPNRWDASSNRIAHSPTGAHGKPYHSISVKGGTCGVMNNEIIAFSADQLALRYIAEFDI